MSQPTTPSTGSAHQAAPPQRPLETIWRLITRFDARRVNRWMGLRNALGVALPAAIAVDLGYPAYAVVAGMGALNVAAADGMDSYRSRAVRMLASTCLGAAAICVGSAIGHDRALSLAVAAVWAFVTGMLVALGTDAADIGMLSLVSLFIYIARPAGLEQSVWCGMVALAGGLLQTALSILPWPLGRFGPERRALSDFYAELAKAAAARPDPYGPPLATSQSSAAQAALASLARSHTLEGERYSLLVSQGERIRLTLFSLTRTGERLKRAEDGAQPAGVVRRTLEASGRMLEAISGQLQDHPLPEATPVWLEQLQEGSAQLRAVEAEAGPAAMAPQIRDARSQTDALSGQLRAALDLAQGTTPAGESSFIRREALIPWRLRLGNSLATLRANLSLDASACRHAIRLTICIVIGTAIAGLFALQRSYWLAMTIALVLKPDFGSTFTRGVLRLAGTYAGLLLATVLFHFLPPALPVHVLCIGVLVFAQRSVGRANYGILVVAISAVVVFMLSLTGIPPKDVMAARALNTTIGGALAIVIYWAWPTRERTQAPQALASMLDAYRLYFQGVSHAYLEQLDGIPQGLDRLRMDARRSRSNAETSVDRLSAEPGVDPGLLSLANAMLASSHRFIHAVMSLEAELGRSHSAPPREAFRTFSHNLEKTLYFLAARLRGSPVSAGDLADLREDHNRLVQSGDRLNERYALVNIETDRMTNSLNTLAEQVFQWTRGRD